MLGLLFKNTHLLNPVKGADDFIETNSGGKPLTKSSLECCVGDCYSTEDLTCFLFVFLKKEKHQRDLVSPTLCIG